MTFDKVQSLPQDIEMHKFNWKKSLAITAVVITVLRFVLSARIGLGDDEAYYWEWSRYLELSYYDHPGMTAWMIKLGTLLFGQTPIGVRFFGLICNAASGWLLWHLAKKMFSAETAGIAVFLYLFAPIFSLGGMLMVPDAPMGVAWMAVSLLMWRIYTENENSISVWVLAGAVLGFGLISKYTIILLAISFVLLMLTEPTLRKRFLGAHFWIAVAVAVVFCLPILIWNIQFDWPTLKFHLHDRQTGGGGANFSRWGQFFGSQALMLGPALFLMCLTAWIVSLPKWRERSWRFLLIVSAPTFALFSTQALFAEFKPHWTAPAFMIIFIGVAELICHGFWLNAQNARRAFRFAVVSFILVIFIPLNFLFYVGTVYPVIPKTARLIGVIGGTNVPWDPKFDPTNDLYGWPEAANAANEIRKEFTARGEPVPFLSSSRYQLVSQLAFVTGEKVLRVVAGRDQYSFIQTADVWKPLLGQASIFITDNRFERDPRGDQIFDSCDKRPAVEIYRHGELARRFDIWLCRGFRGL